MRYHNNEALIYIEPNYDDKFNKAIVDNYHFITDSFNQIDIPFIYLPTLLNDQHINKVLEYNHPYLQNAHRFHPQKLYYVIINSLNLNIERPTLVYLSDDGDATHQFDLPSHEIFSSPERLFVFLKEISSKIFPIADKAESVLFRRAHKLVRPSFNESREESFDRLFEDSETLVKRETIFKKSLQRKTADNLFEEHAFKIPDDLQKQIETLSEAGYLSHLIKYLEILQQATRKLSRLRITADYKIYLLDYEMMEVEMSPLPKALYFLFLNHPQGVVFKELPDYREELMMIYKNISLRESPDKVRKSIKKLTNPFDNSVNEKCSRIRAAFLKVVAEDIAENYYIIGDRGEAKKILLDRELVIYDKQTTLQGLQNSQ